MDALSYRWYSIPHRVNVRCPACGKCADFNSVVVRNIATKRDVNFFKRSTVFEYQRFRDPKTGQHWHGALYYAGLHGTEDRAISGLPEGHPPDDWLYVRPHQSGDGPIRGAVSCGHCLQRVKHTLRWPDDAYFSIAYKHHVLWAFNQEMTCELYTYLLSSGRDISKYRWGTNLLHIPTLFKTHKAREVVCKQLLRLLDDASKLAGARGAAVLRSRRVR